MPRNRTVSPQTTIVAHSKTCLVRSSAQGHDRPGCGDPIAFLWSNLWSAKRRLGAESNNPLRKLVADAVAIEPVSAAQFPATGPKTGIYRQNALFEHILRAVLRVDSEAY